MNRPRSGCIANSSTLVLVTRPTLVATKRLSAFWQLSLPPRGAQAFRALRRPSWPVARALSCLRNYEAHVSTQLQSLGIGWLRPCGAVSCSPSRLARLSSASPLILLACPALPPLAAPSTVQSRLPAEEISPRVCPPGRDASLRAQTLPPGSTETCLPAHPLGRVQLFPVRA